MRRTALICCLSGFFTALPQLLAAQEPEILYERELTEEERSQETIGKSEWPIKEGSLEKVRQHYKDPQTLAEVPHDIFKVELFRRDIGGIEQAYLRLHAVGYWGRDWARSQKLHEWTREATAQITLGQDKDGFKFHNRILRFMGGDRIYYDKYDEIGYALEEFDAPNGQRVSAYIYKGITRPIPLHEFLHGVVKGDYRLVQTSIGPVLVLNNDPRRRSQVGLAAWMSGDDVAVYVGANNVDAMDLVKLYGDKFPSTLPNDLTVDKTEWGRTEMELTVPRLEAEIEKTDRRRQKDRFHWNLYRIRQYVYLPVVPADFPTSPNPEQKRELFNAIFNWWEENRENTYWDEEVQMLVAKGQTPKEVAEAARQQAEAEEQARRDAILNPPVTAAQIADARKKLVAYFEQQNQEYAEKDAAHRGERLGGDRVKWEKVREGEWTHAFPSSNNGPLIVDTYTGPEIEQTDDRARPLRAVFQMHRENPRQLLRFRGGLPLRPPERRLEGPCAAPGAIGVQSPLADVVGRVQTPAGVEKGADRLSMRSDVIRRH